MNGSPLLASPPAAPVRRSWGPIVAVAVLAGVALDGGIRGGPDNAVVVLGLLASLGALLLGGGVSTRHARLLAAAAVVPISFLAVRTSPWLVVSNVLVTAALAGSAVVFARGGSLFDTSPVRLVARSYGAPVRFLQGPVAVARLVPLPSGATARRVERAVVAALVAVPVLAVVVALLASADAVFAGLLLPDIDLGPVPGHIVLIAVFTVGVLGFASLPAEVTDPGERRGRFGTIEVTTMLALASLVVALFACSQLVARTSAGRRLVTESGITPAQYARSGFFQLCWATAILVGFLALVRALAAREVFDGRAVRILAAAVPVLALSLVGVSLHRMERYDAAFGMTMLRLWVIGAAVWMGAVLVMVAARNAGAGRGQWVTGGAVVAAAALVVFADAANPEAFVARHNIDRAQAGAELDVGYLGVLSDDAVPALVHAAEHGAPVDGAIRCEVDRSGVAALNLGAARGARARDRYCRS